MKPVGGQWITFRTLGLLSVILIVFCGQPSGFCRLRVLAGTPPLLEKHSPWVWQLEQNKRLLFASCQSASHNTQLTACIFLIHSQELGVSQIREINMVSSAFCPFCKPIWEQDVTSDCVHSLLAGREIHTHTYLHYLPLLCKTTSLSCKQMLSVLFWLLYKHLHKLVFSGEKRGFYYLRKLFHPMKESISFRVSFYIPFPLKGQTVRPPMTRCCCL